MSRYTGLIQAFDKLAEASATVALELQALETPEAGAPLSAPVSAVRGSGEAPAAANPEYIRYEDAYPTQPGPGRAPTADTEKCPSHDARWQNGRYGQFCPAKAEDPAWANKKGYCTITPESAPKWLEIHGRAA